MTEDSGLKLLAAIEAMHQELRELRKEALEGRVVREELEEAREQIATSRADGRRRSQEWRARNVTQRHGDVTVGSFKAVHDLGEDHKAKEIPASRHRNVTRNVTGPTWESYSAAYERRHKAKPVRNATTNSQMSRFVKRVGEEEGPSIAEFYVFHNAAFYVLKLHPVGLLLSDAEKLRTEWATGRRATATSARQEDATQANLDGWIEAGEGAKRGLV